jgi:hypothetical protein
MASVLVRKSGFAKKEVRLLTDARATTNGIRWPRGQEIASLGVSKSASTLNGAFIAGCNGRFNGALTTALLQELG